MSGHYPQVSAKWEAEWFPQGSVWERSAPASRFQLPAERTDILPCLSTGCADLQTLDTMQPMERKRQGYIHELIQTEERYVDDLQLVVEVRVPAGGLWAQGAEGWEACRQGVTSDV